MTGPQLSPGDWITLEAGDFYVGAQHADPGLPNYDPEASYDDLPVRKVHLATFQIARHPVTVREYRIFLTSGGYQDKCWWSAGGFGKTIGPGDWHEQIVEPDHPVTMVTWHEAAAYCSWLGARLLTEAEWERAARGTTGRKYPWGNETPDKSRAAYDYLLGVVHDTGVQLLENTRSVGDHPAGATPEGIEDMAGNVWEWTADWHSDSQKEKAVRGGALYVAARGLRASCRDNHAPDDGDPFIGFRCVRQGPPST
jgi:formylglycine-generating enzyme required for sulfatase activity